MTKTKVINLAQTEDKWLKLMLHFNNSIPMVFRIKCTDPEAAGEVRKRLAHVMNRQPTWFNMVIAQRQCDVYVVKCDRAQDVVIKDELPQMQL